MVPRVTRRFGVARNTRRTVGEIGLLLGSYEGTDLQVRRLAQ